MINRAPISSAQALAQASWRPTCAVGHPHYRYEDVWFVDSELGWAVAMGDHPDEVLRTTNGGKSWESLTFGSPETRCRCISFASPARGWIGTFDRGATL